MQMLDHVVSFEHRDDEFRTPLHLAAGTRNHETTRLLLEHGAKVDVTDRDGRTALHRCQSNRGGLRVAELLLAYSSATSTNPARPGFINLLDRLDKTALSLACEKGNEKMAAFLLENSADPNLADSYRKTALYTACERGMKPR